MKVVVKLIQYLLGIYFLFVGVLHFLLPEGMPAPMIWMYDLSPNLHWFSGTAEIAASLTLLLGGHIKALKALVPYAATGLLLLMVGAIVWHSGRGETSNMIQNAVFALAAAFVAYGRWRIVPYEK